MTDNLAQLNAAVMTGDWTSATNWLNSLPMYAMLPALQKLSAQNRQRLVAEALKILNGLGWKGSADRIRWATEIVEKGVFPPWRPADLPLDQIQAANSFLETPDEVIRDLFDLGSFQFLSPGAKDRFRQAMNNDTVSGKEAAHAPQLQQLLIRLAERGGVTIMRTFDPNSGPHGTIVGNQNLCSAVDVAFYQGYRFHYLQPKQMLIEGVKRLLSDLPSGAKYDVGFVRPVGGAQDLM